MERRPTLLVFSTVYGIEELLETIYTLLSAYGYEVWMSHKGTVPVVSRRTAFQNCLKAVEDCDLFLGIITPQYGSGKDEDEISITHKELRRAVELDKLRWLLAHRDVAFARRILRDLGHDTPEAREQLSLRRGAKSISDLRVIEMYEEAIRYRDQKLANRTGNWVQEYEYDQEARLFVDAQFSRIDHVASFLKANLSPREGAPEAPEKGAP